MDNPLAKIPDSELSHTLYLKGVKLAKEEASWVTYDKNREAFLAAIADDLVRSDELSFTQAMVKARNTSDYKTYIDEMAEAKSKKIIARAKYASVEFEIRIRLNKNYMERMQMNAGRQDT